MTARSRRGADDALLAAGIVLLGVLVAAPGAVPWPRARALLALFAFFYPAGELARRALFPNAGRGPLVRGLVSISLGNALLALAAGAAWAFGNRLSSIGPIAAALGGLLGALALLRRTRDRVADAPERGVERGDDRGSHGTSRVVLLAAAALTLVPLLWHHDRLSPASDSLDHVGSLRKRIETDAVFPRSAFYAVSRENGPDARKGLLHASLALVARTTRTPVLDVWDVLPFAGALWTLLAVLAAARALLPARGAAEIATLLFALSWDGGPAGPWLVRLGQPSRMMLAPYWTAWALILPSSPRPPFALLAALGFGMAAIHTQAPLFVVAFAAFLGLFLAAFGRAEARAGVGRIARGAFGIAAGAAPYLIVRMIVSTPLVDTIHTERQGVLAWSDHLFLLNPFWLVQSWGVLGLLSVPLALSAIRRARGDVSTAFIVSGVAGAALIVLNPIATPLAYGALGYLAVRFVWFTPHAFLLAAPIAEAVGRLARGGTVDAERSSLSEFAARVRPSRPAFGLAQAGVFAAALLFVAATGRAAAQRFRPGLGPKPGVASQAEAFAAVDRAVGERAAIASDPATGYAVPALTRHWTISAMAQHSPPNDPDARDRLRDTRRVLSPYVNAADTVALLRQYGAAWVLLNASGQTALSHYIYFPGPNAPRLARAKFDGRPDLFTPVLDEGGLRLYRLTETALRGEIADPGASQRTIEPARAAREGTSAGRTDAPRNAAGSPTPYELLRGEVLTPEVAPGGRIAIESAWVRSAAVPEANRFLVVRLDRPEPAGTRKSAPLAKVWRRLEDSARGERTRARIAFAPGEGFLPPDEWPLDTGIRDVSELQVPADLAVGDYVVKIRVYEEAFYPNLRPEDLISLSDSFDGVPIGTVRVTKEERQTS